MSEPTELIDRFLGPLSMHLQRGDVTYRRYLADGKKFLHACTLRENNDAIRELVLREGHRLPPPLQQHAILLVAHLDVWTGLWDQLYDELDPAVDAPFAFENEVVFPRRSVDELMAFYAELRG